jgi:hypothetical protein
VTGGQGSGSAALGASGSSPDRPRTPAFHPNNLSEVLSRSLPASRVVVALGELQ